MIISESVISDTVVSLGEGTTDLAIDVFEMDGIQTGVIQFEDKDNHSRVLLLFKGVEAFDKFYSTVNLVKDKFVLNNVEKIEVSEDTNEKE